MSVGGSEDGAVSGAFRKMVTKVLDGGADLRRALSEMSARLGREGTLRVGFLENSTYPDGTSVPMVAAINEFGAPSRGQPPRPFFRNMIAEHQNEWPRAIEANLISTRFDVERTLELVGEGIASQLRQSIVDLVDPPLAASTIRAKGFDKPLIDTSVMLNSVGHEVETK
jgi:hypothetical protein